MDLTIEGNAYINGTFEKRCVGIEQGKISAIKKILKGDEHLNFGRKLILPAGIDLHSSVSAVSVSFNFRLIF